MAVHPGRAVDHPAGRPDRPRHRGAGRPLGPDAGRLPQRHVRQRGRDHHRPRGAQGRAHRDRAGVDHREHHRQPAARVRRGDAGRRVRARVAAVQPDGGEQRHDHAVPRRRGPDHAGRVRPDAVRPTGPAASGDLPPEPLDVDPADRRLRRKPGVQLHDGPKPDCAAAGAPREGSRQLPAADPAARRGHGADHRAGRGAGGRRVAGAGEVRHERVVHRRHHHRAGRECRRALQRDQRRPQERDDAGRGDCDRQQRADCAARGADPRPRVVRDGHAR